jgi:hypothetical protein
MNIVLQEKPNNNSRVYGTSGGTQIIDVVNEMSWTISNKRSRRDAPRMRLVEYQQSTGQLIASIIYFSRVLKDFDYSNSIDSLTKKSDPIEVYKLKYFGDKTGYEYSIPYFNPKNLSRNNEFSPSDPFAPLTQLGTSYGGSGFSRGAAQISTLYSTGKEIIDSVLPGKINFEFPQTWNNTSPETYSTTFDLINTTNFNDVINNWKFCHLLSYQNTPSRRNFAIMDPPVIYTMSIPGIVNFPVCYMNELQITNLGNTRLIDIEGKKRIIPEAYRITFTLTSLLMPSRNIMGATRDGSNVEVIGSSEDVSKWIDYDNVLQQVKQVLTPVPQPVPPPSTPAPIPQTPAPENYKNNNLDQRSFEKPFQPGFRYDVSGFRPLS